MNNFFKKQNPFLCVEIYNNLYIWLEYRLYNIKDETDLMIEQINYDLLFNNLRPIKKEVKKFIEIAGSAIYYFNYVSERDKVRLKNELIRMERKLLKSKKINKELKDKIYRDRKTEVIKNGI